MVNRSEHHKPYDSKKNEIPKKKEMMAVSLPKKLNLALLKKRYNTPTTTPPSLNENPTQIPKSTDNASYNIPSQKGDDVVKITKFDNAASVPPPIFSNSNNSGGGKKLYDAPSSTSITSSFYSSSVEELSKINFPPPRQRPFSNITPIKKQVPTPYNFGGKNSKDEFKKKPVKLDLVLGFSFY